MNSATLTRSSRPKSTLVRRFGMLDAMIVVFALAPALMMLRYYYEHLFLDPDSPNVYNTIDALVSVCNAFLMALTLALTVIALRKPRPKLGIGLRRPGVAACLAASAATVVMTARMTIKTYSQFSNIVIRGNSFRLYYLYPVVAGDQARIGFAVIGAWVMLLLTRAWRAEPTWLDRAGRVLGCLWIAMLILHIGLPWIVSYLPAL